MSISRTRKPRARWAFRLALTISLGLPVARGFSAEDPQPSPDRLREHIAVLASDDFEGRGPGTSGEEKTVAYLTAQFKRIGLSPGNPDGTYVQNVPLVGITSTASAEFTVGDKTFKPARLTEYIVVSHRVSPQIEVKDSDMIFVGYGVVAPEYGWDDFKGVDVKGKTVVMLINDPPVLDPRDPSKLDESVFKGKAMTYYGRWTYKYEIAAQKGAAACLIIHETGPAGYPFAVVAGSWGHENFDLRSPDGNARGLAVEGWLTRPAAEAILTAAGQDLAALKAASVRRDFRPVPLNAKANFAVANAIRDVASKNVIGRLEGRDPKLKNDTVIYTAHWDHLGRDPRLSGDQIFNGAADNASGTAALIEIAQTMAALPPEHRPKRSILFLSVTAEEKGLLGSRYYAENPLYPLTHTVADLNMDGLNLDARTRDVEIIGSGASTIEDLAADAAKSLGRILIPDTQSEKGYYYRSDHFEFAKVGVPSFYAKAGRIPLDKSEHYIDEKRAAYTENDYHKVSDEVKPDWDYAAAAQDVSFLLEVGRRVADSPKRVEWKAGNEFKARRDALFAKEKH
jgi:Zn-dependent M28 family amino/carboxypeptidase